MPTWSSRFILTVLAPHWLEELEDDARRMREEAAKQKSFHSTKAHGNGGGSNSRDGNADSSSREGNGGSVAAGDDAVADNLAPVMPTVKRRGTSHEKQLSNISTVSNEESYLGSGRSESSVLFNERENDMDVEVRTRKKRKLTNEELALPEKVANMYGEHSPVEARSDGVVEAAPQDLLSPIATTVHTGDTGDKESETSQLGGLVNISQDGKLSVMDMIEEQENGEQDVVGVELRKAEKKKLSMILSELNVNQQRYFWAYSNGNRAKSYFERTTNKDLRVGHTSFSRIKATTIYHNLTIEQCKDHPSHPTGIAKK